MKIQVLIVLLGLFGLVYTPIYMSATRQFREYIGPRFVVSWVICISSAFVVPTTALWLLVIFVTFLATVRTRLDAACRFMLLAALLPNVLTRVIISDAYLVDLTTMLVLCSALFIADVALRDPHRVPRLSKMTAEDALVIVLFLIFWIGATRFPSITLFLRLGLKQFVVFALPYIVLRRSIRNAAELKIALGAVGVSGAILGFYAIYEVANGWAVFDAISARFDQGEHMSKNLLMRGSSMRASVTMSPLPLASYLAFAIVALGYCRALIKSKLMHRLGLGVAILGFLGTQSRGNTILVALALIAHFAARRKWGTATGLVVSSAVGFGLLLLVARVSPGLASFLHVGQQAEVRFGGVYDYRQLLLQRGLEEAATHRWIGASMPTVLENLADITQGQGIVDLVNSYLTIYLISGLLGFTLFASLFLAILGRLWRKLPKGSAGEVVTGRLAAIGLIVTLLGQLSFMSLVDRVPLMLMFALVAARLILLERQRFGREVRMRQEALRTPSLSAPLSPTV